MAGYKGFRYLYSTKHITNTLKKIQSAGRPDKLNFSYMRDTWLLKNNQYSAVLDILKDMQFIDNAGVPTELYAEYQNHTIAKGVLARGIRTAYPALFKAYPEAQSLPRNELEGYFRQQTGKSGSVLDKILSTFKALCGLADFSSGEVQVGQTDEHEAKEISARGNNTGMIGVEPNIHINIQIHIAADTPDEKIAALFQNMKKYLVGND